MKSILSISGIKCDSCEYEDSSVSMKNYDKWLNKPCPVCGNNLLTQPDFDMVKTLVLLVDTQNSNIAVNNVDEPTMTVTFDMDGSGDLKVKNLESTRFMA